jgi:hypothetical protein
MSTSDDSTGVAGDVAAKEWECRAIEDLRAAVLQAMAANQTYFRKEREMEAAKRNEVLAQLAAAAPARAAEVIAGIPQAVLNYRSSRSARVMTLDRLETTQDTYLCVRRYDPWDPSQLRYAARIVFDYCERAGLSPYLHGVTGDAGNDDRVTIEIPLSQTVTCV